MLLKLEKIGKIYDSGGILTVGIRGIDLAFNYNEFVTIEGESGSGKSTLLNVIGANDTYEESEPVRAEPDLTAYDHAGRRGDRGQSHRVRHGGRHFCGYAGRTRL